MVKCFEEVTRIPICLEKGRKYQVEIKDNYVVVSKEAQWKDITKSCYLDFRNSHHCNGRYIAVMYQDEDKMAAVIGAAGIQAQHGFKVTKAYGAYTSFSVFMRNK